MGSDNVPSRSDGRSADRRLGISARTGTATAGWTRAAQIPAASVTTTRRQRQPPCAGATRQAAPIPAMPHKSDTNGFELTNEPDRNTRPRFTPIANAATPSMAWANHQGCPQGCIHSSASPSDAGIMHQTKLVVHQMQESCSRRCTFSGVVHLAPRHRDSLTTLLASGSTQFGHLFGKFE